MPQRGIFANFSRELLHPIFWGKKTKKLTGHRNLSTVSWFPIGKIRPFHRHNLATRQPWPRATRGHRHRKSPVAFQVLPRPLARSMLPDRSENTHIYYGATWIRVVIWQPCACSCFRPSLPSHPLAQLAGPSNDSALRNSLRNSAVSVTLTVNSLSLLTVRSDSLLCQWGREIPRCRSDFLVLFCSVYIFLEFNDLSIISWMRASHRKATVSSIKSK